MWNSKLDISYTIYNSQFDYSPFYSQFTNNIIDLRYKNPFLMDDDDENEEEIPKTEKEDESPFILKKMEKLFLEKRAVYLWGMVDDRSAKDVVSKMLLLEADKPGKEIKFLSIARAV